MLDQDLEAGMRYHNATRSSYPHLMYMEPSKTHWDSSSECHGGIRGGRRGGRTMLGVCDACQ